MSYTPAEWLTIEPLARNAEVQARSHPERRDLFLCHSWDDRNGAARELCDRLVSLGATVWFSENEVGLGKSLLREIDRGLASSRIGIVLVTPALLESLAAQGVADKELSALLATDRVIPVAHGTTFDALRDVSPLLAARSGLTTGDYLSMRDVATKVAAAGDGWRERRRPGTPPVPGRRAVRAQPAPVACSRAPDHLRLAWGTTTPPALPRPPDQLSGVAAASVRRETARTSR
ncbi:MAG TPA: toll/interleukin-1 receptor domain-containing protein, partial [Candidatus Limnocylindria bacterium]|nr:toll/interleukin-1 receptor domain-containing protein [Candidatus Limnocylindria bacterium]